MVLVREYDRFGADPAGFTSAANRRYLRKGGGSYIIGEKLRSGSTEAEAALSRQGRYKDVSQNLKVKEVKIADDERFVIYFNPDAAQRDVAVRARMIARLEEAIRDSDQLSKDKCAELRGVISTKPGLNRYLRVTPGGLLRTVRPSVVDHRLTRFGVFGCMSFGPR